MQNNRWLQALIVLLVIIASAWLVAQVWGFLLQFSSIMTLFFFAWLLAFILRPVARWLTTRGLPYGLSVMLVYLALAAVFTVGGFLLVPVISQQVTQLVAIFSSQETLDQAEAFYNEWRVILQSWGVSETDLTRFYNDVILQAQNFAVGVLQNSLSIVQSVATLALQLILVLIFSFYFMKDGDTIFGNILHLLPARWEDELRLIALSIEKSFGGFIRGQLLFALVYGVLNAIVMFIPPFELTNFLLVASIVSGLCMIVPLVGNFLAFIPPMLVVLFTPGKTDQWPWLLLALFIMQSIMMNVLGPRIMSSAIGIHPLYVMMAILVGSQVAGVWGALFGIPIAGALNLIGRPLMRRVRSQMPLYRDPVPQNQLTTAAFATGPLAAQFVERRRTVPAIPEETSQLPQPPQSTQPTPPYQPPLPYPTPAAGLLDDDDEPVRPQPTLSAKVWRLLFVVLSRARAWAWSRVQARVSRH